jgi:SAM-dependent methyltransferase
MVSGSRYLGGVADTTSGRPGKHRAAPDGGMPAGLFTGAALDYAAHHGADRHGADRHGADQDSADQDSADQDSADQHGQYPAADRAGRSGGRRGTAGAGGAGPALQILQAGCATAGGDLDLAALRASRFEMTLTLLDDDNDVTRAAVARRADLRQAVLGDLRTAPLLPRSADIVHCCLLLDRIGHSEIVLGRLVEALRPGGLLLLRTADRETAAGFLDRALPRPLRGPIWRSLRPGEPGPYPAIYEPLTSPRGIASFAARHGLVISRREACSRLDGAPRRPVIRAGRWLVATATRGRLTAAHDELRYIIRKPEDRFARVL